MKDKWMITIHQPYDVGFQIFDTLEEAQKEYERLVNEYSSDTPLFDDISFILSRIEEGHTIEKNAELQF